MEKDQEQSNEAEAPEDTVGEDRAEDLEDDPAYSPDDEGLKRIKGG